MPDWWPIRGAAVHADGGVLAAGHFVVYGALALEVGHGLAQVGVVRERLLDEAVEQRVVVQAPPVRGQRRGAGGRARGGAREGLAGGAGWPGLRAALVVGADRRAGRERGGGGQRRDPKDERVGMMFIPSAVPHEAARRRRRLSCCAPPCCPALPPSPSGPRPGAHPAAAGRACTRTGMRCARRTQLKVGFTLGSRSALVERSRSAMPAAMRCRPCLRAPRAAHRRHAHAVAEVDARQLGFLEVALDVERLRIDQRQHRAARGGVAALAQVEVGDEPSVGARTSARCRLRRAASSGSSRPAPRGLRLVDARAGLLARSPARPGRRGPRCAVLAQHLGAQGARCAASAASAWRTASS
jgi:hypothetical protein